MKQGAINRCREISEDPYTYLKQWKEKTNKKIICCFGMHIPEEIVHASGMLPVISWRSNEPVTMGHSHLATFNCGLTRSFIDDLVKDKLGFLDGIVINRICLQTQGLPFIIEQNVKIPYLEYLSLPALYQGAPIRAYLIEEMERFKKGLEIFSGKTIDTDNLNNSIQIYNKNRELLETIYDIRRKKSGILKAKEMLYIVHSSMLMSKEENNELLKDVIDELNNRKEINAPGNPIRVIIYGGLCQTPNTEILDLIEASNMEIVADDIFVGSKYFAKPVKTSNNPIEALADVYLKNNPPCPTKGDYITDWTNFLIDMTKKNNAQGIITLLIKYCPPHMCYYPDIKNKLSEKGIPELLIEVEHEVISFEQIRTRLQTFAEIIQGV